LSAGKQRATLLVHANLSCGEGKETMGRLSKLKRGVNWTKGWVHAKGYRQGEKQALLMDGIRVRL
jgi:hypothetical protein